MCASDKCDETRQGLTLRAHSRSHVHVVLRVDASLDLGFHVVIGVGRVNVWQDGRQLYFTTHTQYQVQSSFLLDVAIRLCPVIVHLICIPSRKTGLLRCCLYTTRRLQWTAVSCKRSICKKYNEFLKAIRLRFSPTFCK